MRRELDKAEWGPFLDSVSRVLSSVGGEANKGSLCVVRPEVRSGPIIGVTYDPKDGEVDIAFEGDAGWSNDARDHRRRRHKPCSQARRSNTGPR